MQDFRVSKIKEGVYSILDAGDSSFYVVEGKEKAAVIDTGVTFGGKIMPLMESIGKQVTAWKNAGTRRPKE